MKPGDLVVPDPRAFLVYETIRPHINLTLWEISESEIQERDESLDMYDIMIDMWVKVNDPGLVLCVHENQIKVLLNGSIGWIRSSKFKVVGT